MNTHKRQAIESLAIKRCAMRNAARTLSIGLGSCLAVSGQYYGKRINRINISWESKDVYSDAKALRSDWYRVWNDMNRVINTFKASQSS